MASSSSSYKKYEIRKRDPDPKSAVLLVIDMQNYFYSMGKPILPAINNTIDLCRRNSVPVIFTRHCQKSPEDYGMLYEWWNGDIIRDGTVEAELIPELDRRDGDLVVEKHTYSAFRDTNLEEKLLEMGIKEVIVTGVMTNLCCETTAREAFVRGFRVFFSTDATATSLPELHDATLKNLAYGFAYLVDCKRIQCAFLKFLSIQESRYTNLLCSNSSNNVAKCVLDPEYPRVRYKKPMLVLEFSKNVAKCVLDPEYPWVRYKKPMLVLKFSKNVDKCVLDPEYPRVRYK